MKTNNLILCAASLMAGLALTVACKDDPITVVEDPTLEVTPATYDVPSADGGSVTVTVTSNRSWEATPSDEWITTSGNTEKTFVLNVSANTSTEARTGTVTVKAETLTKTVTVTQVGKTGTAPVMSVTPASKDVSVEGEAVTFDITTDAGAWKAESDASWAIVAPATGTDNGTITVTAAANDGAARTATITVSAGTLTKTVTVKQAEYVAPQSNTILEESGIINEATAYRASNHMFWNGDVAALVYEINTTAAGTLTIYPGEQRLVIFLGETTDGSGAYNPHRDTVGVYDCEAGKKYYLVLTLQSDLDGVSPGSDYTLKLDYSTRNGATATPSGDVKLTVTPESVNVATGGGAPELTVTADRNWTATSSQEWARVSPASGTSAGGKITVTVEANDGYPRSAVISVTADGKTVTVAVAQDGAAAPDIFNVSTEAEFNAALYAIQASGDAKTINVKADITLSDRLVFNGDDVISVTINGEGHKLTAGGPGYPAIHFVDERDYTVSINRLWFHGFVNNGEGDGKRNWGGAISSHCNGDLIVSSCIFTDNTSAGYGAAIVKVWGGGDDHSLRVYGCTFIGNHGGAGAVWTHDRGLDWNVYYYGNVFYDNGEGDGNGHQFGASNSITAQYNALRGSIDAGGTISDNTTLSSNPLNSSFVPTNDDVKILPSTLPQGYPTVDFAGATISGSGYAGALQKQ
ncbi:MAG: hypothetical protein LBT48_04755 [Prevotellaceae bacterium]|jgi:hypothetical protein|nr:hypothetical protein [Prevotellaceae bacterium]